MQNNKIFEDWLVQSGISTEVQKQFQLSEKNGNIVIPVFDKNGKFLFNKYRTDPTINSEGKKYFFDVGSNKTLYGLHKIADYNKILITEGEKDCLVAWSKKIPAVTSTNGALTFKEEWSQYFDGKEVIVCFDNDETGGRGMAKVLELIPQAKLVFLPDRPGVKDISDYVSSGGDLEELLRTAKNFNSLEDVIDDRAERASLWKSTFFHDVYIKEHTKPVIRRNTKIVSGDDLSKVKHLIDIRSVIDIRGGKRKCIWHNEKTPSMQYYENTNTVYCFGCGKFGDVIEVYRQVNNCSFKEALSALKKMI